MRERERVDEYDYSEVKIGGTEKNKEKRKEKGKLGDKNKWKIDKLIVISKRREGREMNKI